MTATLRFLPEARAEYDAAADWYESEEEGLGADFIGRVHTVLHSISSNPRIHQKVYADVRRAVVKRFPYIVLYQEFPGEVLVISVFHTSRDPKEWQRRVN